MLVRRIRLPSPWKSRIASLPGQYELVNWDHLYPLAQCLVAPCGTKVGKTFGSSLWLSKEAIMTPGLFCVFVAPTYAKCKIAYRYMKAMVGVDSISNPVDGLLEIRFKNGSFIKFLHGRDAEVTIEGEAIDRFIIDESGKIATQVWYSLLTTITQTGGYGIVTGTPRGFNWYYDIYQKALSGDTFFTALTIETEANPYNKKSFIDKMKRLLPQHLYEQYYEAKFNKSISVFGNISVIWDHSLKIPDGVVRFWIHPDKEMLKGEIVHGVDVAKKKDWTVFFSIDMKGHVVGYCRFQNSPYPVQVQRLGYYINKFFPQSVGNYIRYDQTGVGEAFGDMLEELDLNAVVEGVVFTNPVKNAMVMRLTLAVEQSWLKSPNIKQIAHEMLSYEMTTTKHGLPSYGGSEGVHDDVVSAMLLAVSYAYDTNLAIEAEKLLEELMSGKGMLDYDSDRDDIIDYTDANFENDADFFSLQSIDESEVVSIDEG